MWFWGISLVRVPCRRKSGQAPRSWTARVRREGQWQPSRLLSSVNSGEIKKLRIFFFLWECEIKQPCWSCCAGTWPKHLGDKCRSLAYFSLKADRKLPPSLQPGKKAGECTGFFPRTHLGLYLHRVCFERPQRDQISGTRCFGVPGDLHVSRIESCIFEKKTMDGDRKIAPIKKRRALLGVTISLEGEKKEVPRIEMPIWHRHPCLSSSWWGLTTAKTYFQMAATSLKTAWCALAKLPQTNKWFDLI